MQSPELTPMTPEEARYVVQTLKGVAASDGGMSDEERALIAVASEVLGAADDVGPRRPSTPSEAAAVFGSDTSRRRFVQMLLVRGMIDSDFSAE